MDRIRAAGVPTWVTLFTALMGVAGVVVGVAAMIDPGLFFFTEADEALGQRYAGRQLGLGIVLIAAIALRSRLMHLVGLVAGLAREFGDGVAALTDGETTAGAVVFGLIAVAAIVHILRTPLPESPDDERATVRPWGNTQPAR